MEKTILLIEDDTFLQGLAATRLSKEGLKVRIAKNDEEATKAIDEEAKISCILLDLLLPGTDGFGILKKIRENIKITKTPVVVFSNLSETADIQKAKDLGATEYMIKSNFTLDELTEKVKSLIA